MLQQVHNIAMMPGCTRPATGGFRITQYFNPAVERRRWDLDERVHRVNSDTVAEQVVVCFGAEADYAFQADPPVVNNWYGDNWNYSRLGVRLMINRIKKVGSR
jgi:hypothetical protein